NGEGSNNQRSKEAVTWRKPRGFPSVGFVWKMALRMGAPIAVVTRPAKGLVETVPPEVYRAGGEDHGRLQLREPGDACVVDRQGPCHTAGSIVLVMNIRHSQKGISGKTTTSV